MAQRFTLDPFHVLTAPTTASGRELSHCAAQLLDALARGEPDVARYPTPLGERVRDERLVHEAVTELCDREARIVHEVWARLPVRSRRDPAPAPAPWCGSDRAFGWRSR
ncbi:MAG: hypothetical protein U0168_10130 [Nannocystaceae bacterium]|jgi:hypothetical protein